MIAFPNKSSFPENVTRTQMQFLENYFGVDMAINLFS